MAVARLGQRLALACYVAGHTHESFGRLTLDEQLAFADKELGYTPHEFAAAFGWLTEYRKEMRAKR
jgi:hypothetical protein